MTTFCNTVIIYDLKTVSKVGFAIASVAKQSKTKEIASGGTLAMTLILSFSAIYYLLHVIKFGVPKEWGLAMTLYIMISSYLHFLFVMKQGVPKEWELAMTVLIPGKFCLELVYYYK